MRKPLILLFLTALLWNACSTSSSLERKGRYDESISKSVKALKKNASKQKEILVIEKAYTEAMERDSLRILFLKKEGRPDSWEQIFSLYSDMKNRQNKVRPLPLLRITDKNFKTLRVVNFHLRSYDDEIILSKQKAADYYYAHALNLMERGGRQNGRDAYEELSRVKEFYSDYKDIDTQRNKAEAMGISYVLLRVKNNTHTVIPQDLEDDLLKISPGGMNERWIRYYSKEAQGVSYDFIVLINLRQIDVSPESVREHKMSESREVQDGWQYVKDARGNVMKDSLGNDIKVPKTKVINCDVIETVQNKTARVGGTLDFINAANNALLRSFPLAADSKFENNALVPFGNIDALSPVTRKRLGGQPLPFPNDLDMIHQACSHLKDLSKSIVVQNDNILN